MVHTMLPPEPPAGSSAHRMLRWELAVLRQYTREVCLLGRDLLSLLDAVERDDEEAGRFALQRLYSIFDGPDDERVDKGVEAMSHAVEHLLIPVTGFVLDIHDYRPGSPFGATVEREFVIDGYDTHHDGLFAAVTQILLAICAEQKTLGLIDLPKSEANEQLALAVGGFDWDHVRAFFEGVSKPRYECLIRLAKRDCRRAQVHAHVAFYAAMTAGRRRRKLSLQAVYGPLKGIGSEAASQPDAGPVAPRFFGQN